MNGSSLTDIFTLIAAGATAVGTSVTSVGVFLAWGQIRESRRINRTQFEDSLAQHYRQIIHEIPIRALLGEKLKADELEESLKSFYRYIDLTNDQIFLRQQGRVSEQTWENWRDGIKTLMLMPAFDEAWKQIKDKPTTKFDELRELERSGYQGDPYLWKDT